MTGPCKIAVLISGRGSNLKALIDACAGPDYPARIALVVSNVATASGLTFARQADIPTVVLPHRDFPSRAAFDQALNEILRSAEIDLVCLAGFMRLLTSDFVAAWHDRLINIHPSLLPEFPGLNTHERAIAAGHQLTGCSVHFVRSEMDTGPIILQAVVPIFSGDSPDSLAARVLTAEHLAYPLALRLVAGQKIRIVDEQVRLQVPDTEEGFMGPPQIRMDQPPIGCDKSESKINTPDNGRSEDKMSGQGAMMDDSTEILKDRQKTWAGFTKMATYMTAAIVVLLGILALILL